MTRYLQHKSSNQVQTLQLHIFPFNDESGVLAYVNVCAADLCLYMDSESLAVCPHCPERPFSFHARPGFSDVLPLR